MTIYVLNAKVYFKTKKFLFYIFAQNSNKKPRDVQMGKAKVFFFASLIKQIFLKRFLKKKAGYSILLREYIFNNKSNNFNSKIILVLPSIVLNFFFY